MMMCLLRVLSSEKNTDENDVKKGGVFEKFLSLSLPLLSVSLFQKTLFCFGLFEIFYSSMHASRKIQHFNTNTHNKREKKRRETFFSSSSSHALISTRTRRHLKHIKEREIRLSSWYHTRTRFTLFRLFFSLSSFEKKVWRTRRNDRRSWKPGERN